MDTKAKRLWLDALRHGGYKQTIGKLCSVEGEMCCLGVLIDATQDGYWELDEINEDACYSYAGSVGVLSGDLLVALDFSFTDMMYASSLNDQLNYTFNQIADWVETL